MRRKLSYCHLNSRYTFYFLFDQYVHVTLALYILYFSHRSPTNMLEHTYLNTSLTMLWNIISVDLPAMTQSQDPGASPLTQTKDGSCVV